MPLLSKRANSLFPSARASGPVAWIGFSAALLLALVSLAATSPDNPLRAQPVQTLLALAVGVAFALSRYASRPRALARCWLLDSSRRSFNATIFAVAVVAYAAVSWLLFDARPFLDDDVSALMQARIFASGRVTLPLPALPQFFWIQCWLGASQGLDHLCSMYPAGHPALLVPGVVLGIPWLVTPLFGGGLVVLTAECGRELFGRTTGRLAGLLALCSPFVAVLASTHLSHLPTGFFLMLALLSVCRLVRRGRWRDAGWAGFGMAMAFLCRPMTTMVVGSLLALAPAWHWRRTLRRWQPYLLVVALVFLAVGFSLLYTEVITGDWRTPGHQLGLGRRGKFGFGELDWARTHTVGLGARHTFARLGVINTRLLGWPIPVWLVALVPALLRKADRRDLWLALLPLSLLAVYSAFWYFESCFPARYAFCGLPALILLAARGLRMAAARLRVGTHVLLCPLLLCNLAVFVPNHLASYAPNHWDVEPVLPHVVAEVGIRNAVIFMDSVEHLPGRDDPLNDFYGTGFMRNTLTFDGDVVYARNCREDNVLLARQFPGRDYYLYRYNRRRNAAHLYRVTFEGAEQRLDPITREDSRWLLPDPRPVKPRDKARDKEAGMRVRSSACACFDKARDKDTWPRSRGDAAS